MRRRRAERSVSWAVSVAAAEAVVADDNGRMVAVVLLVGRLVRYREDKEEDVVVVYA